MIPRAARGSVAAGDTGMRKLTLSILAASIAFVPAAALAEQHRGGGGHGGGQWRGGGHGGGGHSFRGGGHRRGGFFGGGFFGGGFWGGGGGGSTVVIIGGDGRIMHPGRNWQRRLRRGGFVHPYWWGPQFHVSDWRHYGFADPGHDRRWIRYHDDAYMIDRRGRVVESRENYDWDSYGEQWEMADGIPAYRGRRDYVPTEEDYAWFERHDGEMAGHGDHGRHGGHGGHGGYGGHGGGGWDYSQYSHGGGTVVYGGGPAYGHGYGYGYAYPIIVETTVTTGQTYSEEVIEEYVTVQRPRRRARACNCARPRAPAPRPRPRPPAGERG